MSYTKICVRIKVSKAAGTNHRRTEDFAVKEWEHTLIQNTMGTELNELNKRLEQKEVSILYALF